jgi:hypothetical protein
MDIGFRGRALGPDIDTNYFFRADDLPGQGDL